MDTRKLLDIKSMPTMEQIRNPVNIAKMQKQQNHFIREGNFRRIIAAYEIEQKEYYEAAINQIMGDIGAEQYGLNDREYFRQRAYLHLIIQAGFLFDINYVWAWQKNLRCRNGTGFIEFNINNYEDVFKGLSVLVPRKRMMDLLFNIVQTRKENGPFWAYWRYKMENKLNAHIFDSWDLLRLFDENVFIYLENIGYIIVDQTQYKNIMKMVHEHFFCYKSVKLLPMAIFEAMVQSGVRESEFKPSHINIEMVTNKKRMLMQLILSAFHQKNMAIDIEASPTPTHKLEHDVSIVSGNEVVYSSDDKYLFQKIKDNFLKNPEKMPETFIEYVHYLTNGDKQQIDQLAMLIAQINLEQNIIKKMNVVVTDKIEIFASFLFWLYGEPEQCAIGLYNINDFKKKSIIKKCIEMKMTGTVLNVIRKMQDCDEGNITLWKKLIQSKSVKIKDRAVGNITFISNWRYVFITDKQSDVQRCVTFMGNSIQIFTFKGAASTDDQIVDRLGNLALNGFQEQWIHGIFAAYGLKLLTESKNKKKKSESNTVTEKAEKAIAYYIRDCCKKAENVDCYAEVLYSMYSSYIKHISGMAAIKKLHFVRILKDMYQFRYYRPHHTAKDNRWAFQGIMIDPQKTISFFKQKPIVEADLKDEKSVTREIIRSIGEEMKGILGVSPSGQREN